jgi:hypothetical protein
VLVVAEWKEPYVAVEPITITSKTRVVNLPRRYHPGQGDLVIYYNGMYAVPGYDYNELTPFSIEFTYDLEPLDTVVAHYQKLW